VGEAGLGVCAEGWLKWIATAVVSIQLYFAVVLLGSPPYGEVTNNVVPGDLGRFHPEAYLAMLCRGGYPSHG